MFSTLAFAPLVALLAAQAAHAIVTPNGPGPGDVFKAGSDCTVTWAGDTDSPSPWKSMDIELMSGDNLAQVHVTTVATGQDGSTSGKFTYTCPEVDPFSAIYFYQFSTTAVSNKTFTTRFTIASANGDTTPPANANQPNGGAAIPWGVGKLVDQSKFVPPPPSAGGTLNTNASNSSTTASTTAGATTTTSAGTVGQTSAAGSTASSTTSGFVTSTTGSAGAASTGTSSSTAAASNSTSKANDNSALMSSGGSWKIAGLTAASAMVFALLL